MWIVVNAGIQWGWDKLHSNTAAVGIKIVVFPRGWGRMSW